MVVFKRNVTFYWFFICNTLERKETFTVRTTEIKDVFCWPHLGIKCCEINRQLYLGLVAHSATRILLETFGTLPSLFLSFLFFLLLNWRIHISGLIWGLFSDNRIITNDSERSVHVKSLFSTPNERYFLYPPAGGHWLELVYPNKTNEDARRCA